MTTKPPSKFAVRVDNELGHDTRYSILITTNGYQWYGLPVTFTDQARAHRVAEYLRIELAPEATITWRQWQDGS